VRLLECPSCRALVHAAELKRLAEVGASAAAAGDPLGAIVAWRDALERIPPRSHQHEIIASEIERLSRVIDQRPAPGRPTKNTTASHRSTRSRVAATAAVALGILVKFKTLALLMLTKGKLLLLGLTKGGTLISMFASIGLYGTAWGWPFAAGFVALIYVHEMGHVAALSRYGIRASAPMFLPGIGAVVRLRQRLVSAREEAVVGLAGPIWGTSATLVVYAASVVSHHPILIVLSRAGALLNLFNLAPIWQLDGARAFGALRRSQRWMIVVAAVLAELATGQPLLFVIAILGMLRALERNAPARGDRRIFLAFIALICVLAALCLPTVDPAHTFR